MILFVGALHHTCRLTAGCICYKHIIQNLSMKYICYDLVQLQTNVWFHQSLYYQSESRARVSLRP
jgi:hypothetical protein